MELLEGVLAGEGWRGEDGGVGLAKARDEVDLLEGLLDDWDGLEAATGRLKGWLRKG